MFLDRISLRMSVLGMISRLVAALHVVDYDTVCGVNIVLSDFRNDFETIFMNNLKKNPIMKVEVRLFAFFTKYLPANAERHRAELELKEGTIVKQVLMQLKIPLDEIKLIFINGVHAELEDVLKEGDVMAAFPPVAGG